MIGQQSRRSTVESIVQSKELIPLQSPGEVTAAQSTRRNLGDEDFCGTI